MLGLIRLALKSDLPFSASTRGPSRRFAVIRVRNQPHAMRVRGADLDRPGLLVCLEGRPFRIAAVKRPFLPLTLRPVWARVASGVSSTKPHFYALTKCGQANIVVNR
jgi:hypothetical protein